MNDVPILHQFFIGILLLLKRVKSDMCDMSGTDVGHRATRFSRSYDPENYANTTSIQQPTEALIH